TMALCLPGPAASPLSEAYGVREELAALLAGGIDHLAAEMPDRWLRDLAVAGDPEECAAQIERLVEAGSDSVDLFPLPAARSQAIIETAATELLPRIRRR